MKVLYVFLILLISSSVSFSQKLAYDKPANSVAEALILGNGRLGALVYGNVTNEKIALNDDNFWSGEPKDWNNPQAPTYLPQIRAALLKGDYELADKLSQKIQGPYNQSYQPLGELKIAFSHEQNVQAYSRVLDLQKGVSVVSYMVNGVKYKRTAFASFPQQVIALQIEADKPGQISFALSLSGAHQTAVNKISDKIIEAKGKAPEHVDPSYLDTKNPVVYAKTPDGKGMNYATFVTVLNTGGTVTTSANGIEVKGCDKVVLLITARTSYNGFDKSPSAQGVDCEKLAMNDLTKIGNATFQQMLTIHTTDFQKLFNRLDLKLSDDKNGNDAMNTIVPAFKKENNPAFVERIFQLGRYITIAGSRPGSQPLNLQGIWNEWVRPPWSSNYTLNINAQMNYWPALAGNLAECHLPMLAFTEELAKNGAVTAKINYNCNGWLAHHNADIWRQSAPVGDYSGEPSWANFMGGGIWMSFDFWEYYQYTQDLNFLRQRTYPLLKGAVQFSADWLMKDATGYYIPPFTVSSEATYITPSGYKGYTSLNSGQDIALYGELMLNFIKTCDLLKIKNEPLYAKAKDILAHLTPYKIDEEGKIKEWLDAGIDRPKGGNKNHLSHLIGFYPGRHLIQQNNPVLDTAVQRTLEIFGPSTAGWMHAWEINLWARLRNAEKSYQLIRMLLNRYSTNTLNPDGGYQIDWQMGFTSGVLEMLIQSHQVDANGNTIIELLPALPKEWPDGHLHGVRTRGGYEIDMDWQKSKVTKAIIKNKTGKAGSFVLIKNGEKKLVKVPAGGTISLN